MGVYRRIGIPKPDLGNSVEEILGLVDQISSAVSLELTRFHLTSPQSVLDLMMTYHSAKRLLLDNIGHLQVITSEKDEANFLKLEKIVIHLKRYADTHELWGALDTDEHRAINQSRNIFESFSWFFERRRNFSAREN